MTVIDRDRGFKRFARGMRRRGGPALLIGIQGKEALEENDGFPNVAIGVVQEFGNPDNTMFGNAAPIPARPFLRGTYDAKVKQWTRMVQSAVRDDAADPLQINLRRVGEAAVADIKNAISAGVGDPPKASTLKMRRRAGFVGTKQLIRTGQLKNSITYKVEGR
jgi:hypothetical protein